MVEPALDFSRYAPAGPRHRLAVATGASPSAAALPAPILPADTLGEALAVARFAASALCRSLGIAAAIVRRRLADWVQDRFDAVMRSPMVSWSLAGVGWGGFIGVSFILHLAR